MRFTVAILDLSRPITPWPSPTRQPVKRTHLPTYSISGRQQFGRTSSFRSSSTTRLIRSRHFRCGTTFPRRACCTRRLSGRGPLAWLVGGGSNCLCAPREPAVVHYKDSRRLSDDFPIPNDIDWGAAHAGGFARCLRGLTQRAANPCGETFASFGTFRCLHFFLSNSCADAPELSYTAQDSAMGW